uniref:Uncharacterized protein n=1 Tax=Picea glauca TaxID=3330 RepID=A0A117NHL7_PICGL|nr:hypothetical protein ABT39_MTgene4603 [Picea glauca]QHR90723.1 hypothetical protein Q903MT_gene4749 [Picea sitchensis]
MQVIIQGIEAIGMSLGSVKCNYVRSTKATRSYTSTPYDASLDAGTPTGDYTTGTGSLLYLHLELLPSSLLVVPSQPWLLPPLLDRICLDVPSCLWTY